MSPTDGSGLAAGEQQAAVRSPDDAATSLADDSGAPATGGGDGSAPAAAIAGGVFEEYLRRCAFPAPGSRVTCAVSGGADSLALLVLATAAGLDVTVVHVDHGLRASSGADAAVVAAAAAACGAGFRCERVRVEPGPNLEARARRARYAVLSPATLLGHTADDQAETVLLNLLRGAGLDGTAAMRPGPRRPLLGLRRRDTRRICRLAGLTPVEDESNRDPAFRRNRVRHEVLPLLDEVFERDVTPLLCRHADLAHEAAEALDEAVADLDPTDCAALATAPRPLARWAIRRWITTTRRRPLRPAAPATGPSDASVPARAPHAAPVDGAVPIAGAPDAAASVGPVGAGPDGESPASTPADEAALLAVANSAAPTVSGVTVAGVAVSATAADEGHPPDLAAVDRVLAVATGKARATDVGAGWRVSRTAGRLRLVAPARPAPIA